MKESEVKELIQNSEDNKVEFKPRVSSFGTDICAFANSDGGVILFGITDDGKIKGVQKGDEEKISSVADKCDPPVRPKIEKVNIDNKALLIAYVEKTGNLHSLSGRVYKRVGSTNRQLSTSEILKLGQKLKKITFGSQICKEATAEDIDEKRVRWFLRKTLVERNLDIDPSLPIHEVLERLNLLCDGELTNAAILMFGKTPQKFHLQSEVRCARFKGEDPSSDFIDMKVLRSPIYEQVDKAEQFVMEHIKRSARIKSGQVERQEKWEYPLDAVREAIANAVVHRDYFSTSNTQVRIFDDRLEIWNPGTLPEGMTIEDLKGKHESNPQNPLLAHLFFLVKYIEQWGTGTNRIVRLCEEYELPEPEFEDTGSSFIVTLRKSRVSEEWVEALDLNERQREAVDYVREEGKITNREYRDLTEVSRKTAKKDLADLVEKEVFRKKGKGRGTHYILGK